MLSSKATWIGLCLLFTSCISNKVGFREQCCDPEIRLERLLDVYEHSKEPGGPWCACYTDLEDLDWIGEGWDCGDDAHVIVDCHRVQNEIERLSFEFPEYIPALLANAMIAYEMRDRVKAGRFLDQVFQREPAHPEAALMKSRLMLDDGNLPTAKRLLAEQMQLSPAHAGLREANANILFLEGRYEMARAEMRIAEDLGASPARMAFNLGLIAETQGDLDGAADMYSRALEFNSEMGRASERLAGVNARRNNNRPR